MINDIFETLGFKEEETKTYLALLDTGPSSGGDLSKKLGMPRPTVYGYLEKLVSGGLVTQSIHRGVKVFTPESGERIRVLYKRKIEDLRTKEKALDNVIPKLEKRSGLNLMRPRIHFFEGRSGMEAALQDNLSYSNLTMLAFWSIRSAIEATSEEFFWYLNKERIKRDMHLRGIWPPEQAVDVKRYPFMGVGKDFKREIRVAPTGIDSSMGYWIYANKVLFASSSAESFCFVIESSELVEMMSNQHKVIWDISTPITPKQEDMRPFLNDLYNDD
ncbi:MAG: helix-turn-helix domain-containing protein [Micavibrio sp.]|nr:helix-turn-helix domain-containing protein [Micavibrio sp.]